MLLACGTAPLVRFLAPAALSSVSSPLRLRLLSARPRELPSRYVPSSGFLTLSTACSSTACPALFRAGALLEFHALQSFSLDRSRGTSRRPCCLPVIHHHRRVGRRLRRGTAVPVALSPEQAGSECDFKALLPGASPLRWPRTVRPAARPMLSWASGPFRVLPPDRVLVCFHRAPPSSFRSVRLGLAPFTDFTGSPESLPGRDWPCSAQHGRPSWGFPPRR